MANVRTLPGNARVPGRNYAPVPGQTDRYVEIVETVIGNEQTIGGLRVRARLVSFSRGDEVDTTLLVSSLATVLLAGQSNADKLYTFAQAEYEAAFNALWGTPAATLSNGSATGSSLLRSSITEPDTNYWWDDTADAPGPKYYQWLAVAQAQMALGRAPILIPWDQGEGDSTRTANSSVRALYKTTGVKLFQRMRTDVGAVPIAVHPLGRRGDVPSVNQQNGYQAIRNIQKEWAAENAWIIRGPEKYDTADDGIAHLDTAGYKTVAVRYARKEAKVLGKTVSGGVDGPRVTGAVRTGTTVVVTLAHDGGTDFTPASAITGFRYTAAGSAIAISAAVRTNATTITLTLASAPAAGSAEVLYYAWGCLETVGYANMVRDNQSVILPLQSVELSMPTQGSVETDWTTPWGSTMLFNHRAKDTNTGTQIIPNAIAAPSDGVSQSGYDAVLGSSASSTSADPTLVAASGGVPAYLLSDGTTRITVPGSTFLRTLGVDKSWSYGALFKAASDWSTLAIGTLLGLGGGSAAVPGLTVRYVVAGNNFRLQTSDGTTQKSLNAPATALPTTGYVLVVIAFNATTKVLTVWMNSTTPVTVTGDATTVNPGTATIDMQAATMASGSGLIAHGMAAKVVSNAEVGALRDFLAAKYSITIF